VRKDAAVIILSFIKFKTWKKFQEGRGGHIISIEKTGCSTILSAVLSLDLKEKGKRWAFTIEAWVSQWITVMSVHKHHLITGSETLKSHLQHFLGNNSLRNFILILIIIKSFGAIAII